MGLSWDDCPVRSKVREKGQHHGCFQLRPHTHRTGKRSQRFSKCELFKPRSAGGGWRRTRCQPPLSSQEAQKSLRGQGGLRSSAWLDRAATSQSFQVLSGIPPHTLCQQEFQPCPRRRCLDMEDEWETLDGEAPRSKCFLISPPVFLSRCSLRLLLKSTEQAALRPARL